jgi:hypothetical protein
MSPRPEKPDPRGGVRRFASDHPTGAPVLDTICEIARERGELPFRGQAFYVRAPEGVALPPNLRTLVTYNILEKVGPSTPRGAYYKVTDLETVADELAKLPRD